MSASLRAMKEPLAKRKLVNLALQGGGAHGAFSWGVLDRLLEDERIEIEALTGASAGAMNAVALAAGSADGDRDEARAALRSFWTGVLREARNSPLKRSPIEALLSGWNLDTSPAYVMFDLITRVASPYDFNPLNLNPLRDLLLELVDFERVRKSKLKVFISATSVQTGRAHVWEKKELTAEHVMASACLPLMFQAVEIDGVPYWDGGFTGNPALWPLFESCRSDDVVLVQINPVRREGAPRTARDIVNRINEITFNASLLRDLRAIDFVGRLIDEGRLEGTGYRRVLMHTIGDEETLSHLGASSKFNVEPEFIEMLFQRGRAASEAWLRANFRHLGVKSTVDIRGMFQGEEDSLDGERLKSPRKRKSAAAARDAGG
ncbi:MAG: patatin-like phospholipase family protein [Alphaproteobacteria bacterium]|nr:patatin-like phospholipase family protein [Alphaproteobacteria bacterium]